MQRARAAGRRGPPRAEPVRGRLVGDRGFNVEHWIWAAVLDAPRGAASRPFTAAATAVYRRFGLDQLRWCAAHLFEREVWLKGAGLLHNNVYASGRGRLDLPCYCEKYETVTDASQCIQGVTLDPLFFAPWGNRRRPSAY